MVAAERRRRTRHARRAPRPARRRRGPARGARRRFDDALATTTAAAELAGRLAWLDGRARPRPGSSPVLPVGDHLQLDLAAHELRRDGQVIHLRPKEFGLLALLAAHPGRAYTRRELLHVVWGPAHVGGPRTVDVHVRWLRSKIEPRPSAPAYLVTVRGVGYRLDEPPEALPASVTVNRPLTRRTRRVDEGDRPLLTSRTASDAMGATPAPSAWRIN